MMISQYDVTDIISKMSSTQTTYTLKRPSIQTAGDKRRQMSWQTKTDNSSISQWQNVSIQLVATESQLKAATPFHQESGGG